MSQWLVQQAKVNLIVACGLVAVLLFASTKSGAKADTALIRMAHGKLRLLVFVVLNFFKTRKYALNG